MRFAVSLLTIIAIASIIGTVLKQNEPYENYIIKFGQFWFEMFNKLGLYDVYHSSWFLLILLFLVISTSLCIWRNTPNMLREWRTFKEHAQEKSLRAFSHQSSIANPNPSGDVQQKISQYLIGQGYAFKVQPQESGDTLIAAKMGTHQRLGYILTHAAIVIICFGGLLDGNLPFKVQELLGNKRIEVLDIPASQVPEISRLKESNLSYRANMTLPEGASSNVAFLRVRDGYLLQELPFRVALLDFRIQHYPTGQPKSFESDVEIIDPELKAPLRQTIRVNHPLIYKGVAIYQSDFQDGGSGLDFKVWNLSQAEASSVDLKGQVFKKGTLGEGAGKLTVEFNEFRKFNIINLSPDGKGKPQNVGPNTTYKLRNASGQAREFVTYMQPLNIDGKAYFVFGVRDTVQDDFKYLRIPAGPDMELEGFMRFRAVMLNPEYYPQIARRLGDAAMTKDSQLRQQFEQGAQQLLKAFAEGGYTKLAKTIEAAVPEAQRDKAAEAYVKMLHAAAYTAYNISQKQAGKRELATTQENQIMLQDSLNAMNDMMFYGTPYLLQLRDFQQLEASGFQLTKSPGQFWVYLGSVLLVLGVFAMFYIRERRLWLLIKANEVLVAMSSNRKNMDFEREFNRTQQQLRQLLT
ncbi:MAG TPA: cytochrome c biogenesis protein ResB [Methylophilus sp.]|nr:cytochrome c biogenesis protein ResB [Methylophilus sp.]HQQ32733.1 cytochrome c biogenesis protein ResB [Methylophilus sp.]